MLCGAVFENLLAVGWGDGNLYTYDIQNSKWLFGYGVTS